MDDQRKKMTVVNFNVLLFLEAILCQVVILYKLLFLLIYMRYEALSLECLSKKTLLTNWDHMFAAKIDCFIGQYRVLHRQLSVCIPG